MDLKKALLKDRFALTQRIKKLSQFDKNSIEYSRLQAEITVRFNSSADALEKRNMLAISLDYPENLPVSEHRNALSKLIAANQVVIIAGETGSGKTTQLPKICLELGFGRKALIAHTQPRRVAASSVASRIAEEMQVELGQQVGYQVRFKDHSTDNTLLKLMTDGVLLAEIPRDRFLEKYDCIIIDEAHERSLNIDFLLGYIKKILPKRPDLKIIVTSATIDEERFSKHFDQAPIFKVSGRTYPVDIRYRPLEELSAEMNTPEAIGQLLKEMEAEEKKQQLRTFGDVLVFLPGEKDIREASKYLRHSPITNLEVLPLYARLGSKEQQKIFHPETAKGRRVVLATNVAETSLTVPGIRYVIDGGFARVSRYSARSKVQQLPIEKISKASAAQRMGRCGRIAEGICYRLYSEEDFELRPEFTEPEILRTNLAAVILQMQSLRIGEVKNFPFLQMPDKRFINDGYKTLVELGAIEQQRLTRVGRKMSAFPVDPKLSRILLQADKEKSLSEVLIIVSGLSIQDPRDFPAEKKEAARQKHSEFKDEKSDFLGLLNLWSFAEAQRQDLSKSQFNRMCQKRFLSAQRMYEWREVHRQLYAICRQQGLNLNGEAADYAAIHKALLTGFAQNLGFQSEQKIFLGTRNRQFRVFPTSCLYKKPPKWLMSANMLDTSQLFSHMNAGIDPEWVGSHLTHLLKYQYSEPHFNAKRGEVIAFEKSTLYGLVVNEKTPVSFSNIDKTLAREIFIREGLVEEKLRSKTAFYQHNKKLRAELVELEDKTRRKDLIVNDEVIFNFYQRLLASEINNVRSLERWVKKNPDQSQRAFAEKDLFRAAEADISDEKFPKTIEFQGVSYSLNYRFEPGHIADGVSVDIPITALNRVPKFLFEWLVPGLLQEKSEVMIKSLPKQWRKHLVPVPDSARKLSQGLVARDEPMADVLKQKIFECYRLSIPEDAFQVEKLDRYYLMNIRLFDEKNNLLEQSRDLPALLKQYKGKVQQRIEKTQQEKKQFYDGWNFPDLDRAVELKSGHAQIQSYPCIVDFSDKVAIEYCDYEHVREQKHRKGLCRLVMLTLKQQCKYLEKELFKNKNLLLKLPVNVDKKSLVNDVVFASVNHCFFSEALPFSEADFYSILEAKKSSLIVTAQQIEKIVQDVIESAFEIRKQLSDVNQLSFITTVGDINQQLQQLFYPGCFYSVSFDILMFYPKYFQAIEVRLSRLQGNVIKENQACNELAKLYVKLYELKAEQPEALFLPSVQHYRWMLEDYRISLFAQNLKTRQTVSMKRLNKLWQHAMEEKKYSV